MRHSPRGRTRTSHSSPHFDRGHQDHRLCRPAPRLPLKERVLDAHMQADMMTSREKISYREVRIWREIIIIIKKKSPTWYWEVWRSVRAGEMEQKKEEEGMKESCRWEERRWERPAAKEWKSQQIGIMMREWTARDLEWLVKRAAKEEKRWRIFVLFTYWDPGCMITTLLQSPQAFLCPSPSFCPPRSPCFFLYLCVCFRSSVFVPVPLPSPCAVSQFG